MKTRRLRSGFLCVCVCIIIIIRRVIDMRVWRASSFLFDVYFPPILIIWYVERNVMITQFEDKSIYSQSKNIKPVATNIDKSTNPND